jgi:hypothetical protein
MLASMSRWTGILVIVAIWLWPVIQLWRAFTIGKVRSMLGFSSFDRGSNRPAFWLAVATHAMLALAFSVSLYLSIARIFLPNSS